MERLDLMDQKPSEPGASAFELSMVPPGRPAERTEPPPQSQVAPPATGNYLVRHWRGELPLGVNCWVNMVLVNVLLAVAIVAASAFVGRFNQCLRFCRPPTPWLRAKWS